MNETQSNNNESIKTLQTELKQAIQQTISNWVNEQNLKSDNAKSLLHILCPKCKQDIDNALSQKDTNRLKEIITNSIYNEMTGFLSEGCEIITFPEFFSINMPNNNRYFLEAKGAHIEKNNEKFMFLEIDIDEKRKKVSFQDCEKFLNISFIKDKQSKAIRILNSCNLQLKILTVEQEEEKESSEFKAKQKLKNYCLKLNQNIPDIQLKINQILLWIENNPEASEEEINLKRQELNDLFKE